ncbi:BspA family leucine-rich repeat surface protein [uncultured Cyclobacterium sp.]|uniref:BspA family leucine-rich repeat surface protein n=1 Tax=uncultured Cyclobacterium sp. TaxID=453820 RepID=UPI0030EC22ED
MNSKSNCLPILTFHLLVFLTVFVSCVETEDTKSTQTFTLSTTVNPDEGGVIKTSPGGSSFDVGESVSLTAEPNSNWVFQEWEGDASGSTNPLALAMNSNKSVTAVFVKRDYPLNITIEGEGTVGEKIITNPSAKEYPQGTTVELTPIPKEGWVFDSWSGDLEGNEVPAIILVDKEKNVAVTFREEPSAIFYLAENGITCKCEKANPGDKGFINGVEYEAVDNTGIFLKHRLGNVDMTKLCTSLVTDMSSLFAATQFNQPIGHWDVSNVTSMEYMFSGSPFNQPIGDWDVSKVTIMKLMFYGAAFNHPIENWDVGNVINMSGMFYNSKFNQPINNWDVSKVTYMDGMFSYSSFNQPIEDWNVSNVKNMALMFAGTEQTAESNFNQPLGDWDVSNVTDMSSMFYGSPFNQPIADWDVGNVENMHLMFRNSLFNKPIGDWDVKNVTDMSAMFSRASFNHPLNDWEVGKVTDMSEMFFASPFNHSLADWDVRSVENMEKMFAESSFNQQLGNWDVSGVEIMAEMFKGSPFNQPIGDWDVSNVAYMQKMFESTVFNHPIGDWDVSNVSGANSGMGMWYMFRYNTAFNQDLSSWCVPSFSQSPLLFSEGATSWELPKPIWGTCPE